MSSIKRDVKKNSVLTGVREFYWNGTPEPYPAQLSDVVSIPNDPNYLGWDFNGGNVLLREGSAWMFYYSVGTYGGIDQVYRATSTTPPVFQRTGVALNTPHYANDIKSSKPGERRGISWFFTWRRPVRGLSCLPCFPIAFPMMGLHSDQSNRVWWGFSRRSFCDDFRFCDQG